MELRLAGVEPDRRVLLLASGSDLDVVNVLALSSLGAVIAPSNVAEVRSGATHAVRGQDVRAVAPTGPDGEAPPEPRPGTVYEIETSGTTSAPKRVPISRANLTAFAESVVHTSRAMPTDRIAQNYSPDFDPYYYLLLLAWSVGASIVVPEGRENLRAGAFIERYGVTVWDSVPSQVHLAARLHGLAGHDLSGVRVAHFGGEPLYGRTVLQWRTAASSCLIVNSYGPSETTITALEHLVEPGDQLAPEEPVPIGRPLLNVEVCERDVAGSSDARELCIKGRQRFDGYTDPTHNEGRFVDVDMDEVAGRSADGTVDATHWYRTGDLVRTHTSGALVHVGRIGDMVKVRGARVHLDAVRTVLESQADVDEAWLTVTDDKLVALVATKDPDSFAVAQTTTAQLRAHARPDVVATSELPRTARGKVDRDAALALLQRSSPRRRSG